MIEIFDGNSNELLSSVKNKCQMWKFLKKMNVSFIKEHKNIIVKEDTIITDCFQPIYNNVTNKIRLNKSILPKPDEGYSKPIVNLMKTPKAYQVTSNDQIDNNEESSEELLKKLSDLLENI